MYIVKARVYAGPQRELFHTDDEIDADEYRAYYEASAPGEYVTVSNVRGTCAELRAVRGEPGESAELKEHLHGEYYKRAMQRKASRELAKGVAQ